MHRWIRRKDPAFSFDSLIIFESPSGFVRTSFIIPFLNFHQTGEWSGERERRLFVKEFSFGSLFSVVYWNLNLPQNGKSVKERDDRVKRKVY